ncbi:hypothetical protein B0187_06305 [Haemophilus paracuniculus]|uniref:Uncharacterized protein n=1 Tax=Haemophilus paracuniculus TaxID=734 RepID=A0A1T0ASG8_9PAST|nr:hypothetical protein [Haemophilus paracuniculus]OOR98871.1 hypothetical protein B0187_06305 [Haemophilus paracuniculus]
MTAPKYRLPNRKWYTLPQAIKQIYKLTGEQLEMDDLIHFWIYRSLRLSTFIEIQNLKIKATNENEQNSIDLMKVGNIELKNNDDFSLDILTFPFFLNNDGVNEKELFRSHCYIENDSYSLDAKGFFAIFPNMEWFYTLDENKNKNLCLADLNLFFLELREENQESSVIVFGLQLNEIFEQRELHFEQLVILHDDLIDFLNHKSEKFNNIAELIAKPLSTKTINAQAQLIKDLIVAEYGEDVANNIRKHIDDPHSEIVRDFHAKGLNLPSGKTVQKWINEN